MRRTLVLALLIGALAAPAHAGTAGCPLISDPRGDVSASPVEDGSTPLDSAAARPGEDLLSADVWADRTTLTAVAHVDALPGHGEGTQTPEAQGIWWMWFIDTADGQIWLDVDERDGDYWFHAYYGHVDRKGNDSANASAGTFKPVPGATGSVDPRSDTVRVRLPLKELAAFTEVTPGTTWRHTDVGTFATEGMPAFHGAGGTTEEGSANTGQERDHAVTTRPIVVGKPACVH